MQLRPAGGAATILATILALSSASALSAPQAAPASTWKVFQELDFLNGSWSGTVEAGGRIGGRVVTCGPEVGGATLVIRANSVFPASGDLAEEKTETEGLIAYDGDKGKYVAFIVFSTKVWGVYDVEFIPDGVRFTSRELANFEVGARSRLVFTRKSDTELEERFEISRGGKDFTPLFSGKLTKK